LNQFTNKLLVALPNIKTGIFHKSVVFMHGKDTDGAIGFVINKKYPTSRAKFIASQLKLTDHTKIYFGGPVEQQTGFVLHSKEYESEKTAELIEGIHFTPGVDIIKDIQDKKGPQDFMIILGHSAWAPGQLELEIGGKPPFEQPNWVVTEPAMEYFYGKMDTVQSWDKGLRKTAKDLSSFLLDR
tara:strand:+ start:300 stop:851 length:552 start_codon:yes stop_codon:yes gene_type:complete